MGITKDTSILIAVRVDSLQSVISESEVFRSRLSAPLHLSHTFLIRMRNHIYIYGLGIRGIWA
jgi:hypothetical protein